MSVEILRVTHIMATQQAQEVQIEDTTHKLFAREGALSESLTPVEGFPDYLSGHETPTTAVEDKRADIPMDQVTLKLHLELALSGHCDLPDWQGLAQALREYFQLGWQQDAFSLEFCEKSKEFLFWNAVADLKMKRSRGV